MKLRLLASMVSLAASAAVAQTPETPALNLALPPAPMDLANSAAAVDPPGTYYGDVAGRQQDDSSVQVTGAVSTTIGYAKGFGTGISNSAELHVHKQTDDGKDLFLHVYVSKGDDMPYSGPYYRGGW